MEVLAAKLEDRYRLLPSWIPGAVVGAVALSICMAMALRDPREEGNYGVCPWLYFTGTHCPGCGTSRAINRLMFGDIQGAIGYNILMVITVPFMVYSWLRWVLPDRIVETWWSMAQTHYRIMYLVAGAIISYWVLRNLPWEPFSWLAPSES